MSYSSPTPTLLSIAAGAEIGDSSQVPSRDKTSLSIAMIQNINKDVPSFRNLEKSRVWDAGCFSWTSGFLLVLQTFNALTSYLWCSLWYKNSPILIFFHHPQKPTSRKCHHLWLVMATFADVVSLLLLLSVFLVCSSIKTFQRASTT